METDFNHYVKIYFDDEHEPEETIAEVKGLVEEGYTSGIDPNWEIVENEDTEENKSTGPMKAADVLIELGVEVCPECDCPVGDDWEFEDFSSKTIVTCPQCKEMIHTEDL